MRAPVLSPGLETAAINVTDTGAKANKERTQQRLNAHNRFLQSQHNACFTWRKYSKCGALTDFSVFAPWPSPFPRLPYRAPPP